LHTSILVRQFLTQRSVTILEQPSYSPDLAPADFLLFPRLKATLKGSRFVDIKEIYNRVTVILNMVPKKTFLTVSRNYTSVKSALCVVCGRSYFEGQ